MPRRIRLPLLVVVYTFHNLWPHQRALCDDTFQRHHVVEMARAEGSWVATPFAEAANVGAVVLSIGMTFIRGSAWECVDDFFKRLIECHGVIEWVVEEATP